MLHWSQFHHHLHLFSLLHNHTHVIFPCFLIFINSPYTSQSPSTLSEFSSSLSSPPLSTHYAIKPFSLPLSPKLLWPTSRSFYVKLRQGRARPHASPSPNLSPHIKIHHRQKFTLSRVFTLKFTKKYEKRREKKKDHDGKLPEVSWLPLIFSLH